ncbi:LytTR family transcriptional regulator DNA-binding domain-containing protein [Oscillibacter sp.]|uniref:LytTR family transcriptional regulator DNA-binding domain-containing protein n=1 Tax=Oscillibacter sp. TaxID=1945593 RepID=UPI00339A6F26
MEQIIKQGAVSFGLCSPDCVFSDHLAQALRIWSETVCADVALCVWSDCASFLEDAQTSECAVLFLDADGGEFPSPAALRESPWGGALLLCSDSAHSAIHSYVFHPDGFVSKPVTAATLERPLARCFPRWQGALRRLEVFSERTRLRIPMCDLIWAEACGRSCILHVPQGAFTAGVSLLELTELLPEESFLRCQKSFLINLYRVRSEDGKAFRMSDGGRVPIGRDCRDAALAALAAYQARWSGIAR